MNYKQVEPRRSNPWLYILLGALVGFTFELTICVPLDVVVQHLWEYLIYGRLFEPHSLIEVYLHREWFPGDLFVGILYGLPLGLLYWRIKVYRLHLEALNQELQKQNRYLNTYMTVSSMVAQCLDPHELLDAVLNVVMETVSAEGAAVLLLDEDQANFQFYGIEGPAKQCLLSVTIPADQGIAGSVLQTQRSEVVNDVQRDPRFSKSFASKYGLATRNLIAIPLTAGEEKIGVMAVLNKAGGEPFMDEERLLLDSIAEEIAFAIRNAKIFEYVVNTYCKQRQGEMSCKGCKRPLRSWTPCVKYLETSL